MFEISYSLSLNSSYAISLFFKIVKKYSFKMLIGQLVFSNKGKF